MQEEESSNNSQPTPGAVISPGASTTTQENPVPQAMPPVSQSTPEEAQVNQAQQTPFIDNKDGISWTGPEFAQHDKPSGWYITCVLIAFVLGGAIYFLTKDVISSAFVAAAIIMLGFYSLRKPKDVNYSLNDYGMTVGPKSFSYEEFRSFTVTVEGAYLTVTFLPLRRFATTAGLFYQGQDEEKIINFLADRLPMEKHKPDMIDSFMQRIRF
jgi:hypothetical protein